MEGHRLKHVLTSALVTITLTIIGVSAVTAQEDCYQCVDTDPSILVWADCATATGGYFDCTPGWYSGACYHSSSQYCQLTLALLEPNGGVSLDLSDAEDSWVVSVTTPPTLAWVARGCGNGAADQSYSATAGRDSHEKDASIGVSGTP